MGVYYFPRGAAGDVYYLERGTARLGTLLLTTAAPNDEIEEEEEGADGLFPTPLEVVEEEDEGWLARKRAWIL